MLQCYGRSAHASPTAGRTAADTSNSMPGCSSPGVWQPLQGTQRARRWQLEAHAQPVHNTEVFLLSCSGKVLHHLLNRPKQLPEHCHARHPLKPLRWRPHETQPHPGTPQHCSHAHACWHSISEAKQLAETIAGLFRLRSRSRGDSTCSTSQPCRAQHCSLADCRSFCG